jgi:hypothetical protein
VTAPRYDESLTDQELKALTGPVFGLDIANDQFEVTVIVETPQGTQAHTTAADWHMLAGQPEQHGDL